MERFQAIILESRDHSFTIEILSSDGIRQKCFVTRAIKKVLSIGVIAEFFLAQGKTLPVVKEVVIKSYPKFDSVLDMQMVHGFLKNCINLVQIGACEPEVYKIVEFFLFNYSKFQSLQEKTIFFRIAALSVLFQFGFLSHEVVSKIVGLCDRNYDWVLSFESNFQRGFTIEKIDAKIMSCELLSYASKEFNLNLYVI